MAPATPKPIEDVRHDLMRTFVENTVNSGSDVEIKNPGNIMPQRKTGQKQPMYIERTTNLPVMKVKPKQNNMNGKQILGKGGLSNESLSIIPVSVLDGGDGGEPTPLLRRPFRLDNIDVSKSWDSTDN